MTVPTTFTESAAEIEQLFATKPFIRAVNFHNCPKAKEAQFDRQLAEYSKSFTSVNEDELDAYLQTGSWTKSKPGLIISLFEGYRNGYDVMRPLLERHGFIGWYHIITGFINAPAKEDLQYALGHEIDMLTREYPHGRYALSWEEIRKLSARHVISCHSRSHELLAPMPPARLEDEIVGSQNQFREHLGRPVRMFVSLTGPAYGEHAPTDRLVEKAGFDFVLSNYRIQRIHTHETAKKA